MKIEFEKYQGTGNDFILIDNRSKLVQSPSNEWISRLCKRSFGIGSDGLMLIDVHPKADFHMEFFNPDGSRSLCGNGSRCAVAFARKLGLASSGGTFVTTDGAHRYEILDSGEVKVSIHPCTAPISRIGHQFLHTGSPHLVVEVEHVDAVDVLNEGGRLRRHAEFAEEQGSNVNFVSPMGENAYAVRTYERGVEHETLSCGTGVTAVALSMAARYGASSPVLLHTHGGLLRVHYEVAGEGYDNIWLQGPAAHVFSGLIDA